MKLFSVFTIILVTACTSKIDVKTSSNKPKEAAQSQILALSPYIQHIQFINGKIQIEGSDLENITSMRLVGKNIDAELNIKSVNLAESSDLILVEAAELAVLALNEIMSLIITDAQGAEVSYDLSFSLENNSVTAAMLSDMEAQEGNVLIYNAESKTWEPKPLNGLSYQGTWDASVGSAPVEYTPFAGEYWVVSKDGNFDLASITNWKKGDWAIFNGNEWQQIKNTNEVNSFNGRKGAIISESNDYTWEQIDKTNASIKDLKDVAETLNPGVGEILKWNGTEWAAATDNNAGGAGSVDSTTITDNSITNADISTSAAIAQSKIDGLTASLSTKQNTITTGATSEYLKGNLTLGTLDTSAVPENGSLYFTDARAKTAAVSDIITDAVIDKAPSQNAVFDALANKQDNITTGTTAQYFKGDLSLGTLNTDAVAEGSNLYFTDARAKNATVVDAINDGIVDVAPSQNAVFDVLALKGDVKSDGSVAMSGNLDVGANSLKLKDADTNYISLKAPTNAAADVTFVLPAADGSANQILKTDGSGNLSWINDADTGVTANSVDSSAIINGSIVDADISGSAAIAQSKISGLSASFTAKQDNITTGTTAQYLKGDLSLGTLNTDAVAEGSNLYFTDARAKNATVADAINDGTVDVAPSQNAVFDALTNKQDNITTGTTAQYLKGDLSLGTLNTDAVAEGSNLYFTDARAKTAVVSDTIADAEVGLAPTQNAVFDALALKGDMKSDGSVAMTGNLDVGANKLVGNGGSIGIEIDASGNVGVGTATPATKLEVNGSITADNVGASAYTHVSAIFTADTLGGSGSWSSPVSATCPAGYSLISWALTDNRALAGYTHFCRTDKESSTSAVLYMLDSSNSATARCTLTVTCLKD